MALGPMLAQPFPFSQPDPQALGPHDVSDAGIPPSVEFSDANVAEVDRHIFTAVKLDADAPFLDGGF